MTIEQEVAIAVAQDALDQLSIETFPCDGPACRAHYWVGRLEGIVIALLSAHVAPINS